MNKLDTILKDISTSDITEYLRENRNTAFILWQAEDVKYAAKDLGFENITEDQVANVLSSLNYKSDCSIGITWDAIYNAVKREMTNDL